MRKGNPKGIKDWGDLVKDDVQVITPNPKTSGGARWNYLAAWGYELKQTNGDAAMAQISLPNSSQRPGARYRCPRPTTTFVQRGIGDVLITWENEAFLAIKELGSDQVKSSFPASASLPNRQSRWLTRSSTSTVPAGLPRNT